MNGAGAATTPPAPERAGRSGRAWAWLLTVLILGLAADLASKHLAFRWVAGAPVTVERSAVLAAQREGRPVGALLPRHAPVVVVPRLLEFTLVLNPGAVFGVGPGQRWFFVVFTVAATLFGFALFARWSDARDHEVHVAIALLLAGGLGNLYDRLVYGCVRDFIHPLPGVRWPGGFRPFGGTGEVWPYVSNVADLLLIIGIGMLVRRLWWSGSADAPRADQPARSAASA